MIDQKFCFYWRIYSRLLGEFAIFHKHGLSDEKHSYKMVLFFFER